jgi:hypothetical protein
LGLRRWSEGSRWLRFAHLRWGGTPKSSIATRPGRSVASFCANRSARNIVEHSGTFGRVGVTGWHLGLFCTKRDVEDSGTLWSAGEGETAAEARSARRRRGEVVGFCGRIVGLLWSVRWCASGTLFAHQIVGRWGFLGVFGVRFFNFCLEGGCAERVMDAHRGLGTSPSGDVSVRASESGAALGLERPRLCPGVVVGWVCYEHVLTRGGGGWCVGQFERMK